MNYPVGVKEVVSYSSLLKEQCFLLVDICGHLYFVDSYCHRDNGALLASAPPGNRPELTEWIDRMMDFYWQTPLTLGSVTEVIYV